MRFSQCEGQVLPLRGRSRAPCVPMSAPTEKRRSAPKPDGPAGFSQRARWVLPPGARPRSKVGVPCKSARHAGQLGQRGSRLLGPHRADGKVEPAAREIGSGARQGRSNRDRCHPLHFSQRLRAFSAEWTPALYLAVPVPVLSPVPARSIPEPLSLPAAKPREIATASFSRPPWANGSSLSPVRSAVTVQSNLAAPQHRDTIGFKHGPPNPSYRRISSGPVLGPAG